MLKMPSAVIVTLAVAMTTAAAARAAPVHIVAFGDSATYGWLVARKDAYPAQLQAALRKQGYDVVVKNAGVSGDTTAAALRRFDTTISPGTNIALVEFGTNDLRLHIPAKRMRENLSKIVRVLRRRDIEVLVIGLGSLNLADIARDNDVPYVQWKLPPGKYRARDHAHFNAQGYAILIARMLPQIESLIARIPPR